MQYCSVPVQPVHIRTCIHDENAATDQGVHCLTLIAINNFFLAHDVQLDKLLSLPVERLRNATEKG